VGKWEMVRLGDVAEIQGGYAFKSERFINNGVPIIRIGNLEDDVVNIDKNICYTREFWNDNKAFRVLKNDILIAMSGATVGKIGLFLLKEPALLNQRVSKISVNTKLVTNRFVYHYVKSGLFMEQVKKLSFGCAQPNISGKQISDIQIPLPPLEVQRKIAETLDAASELLAMRKKQLAELDKLIQSVFYDMFNAYFKDFNCYKKLPNLCDFIDYRGKTPEKSEYGIPLITAKNVKDNKFSIEPREFILESTYKSIMTRGFPKINDVIFTTEAPLGNVCRIPSIFDKFAVGQTIIAMQPKSNIMNSEYLEFALTSKEFQGEMLKRSSGSTVKGIRSKELVKISIPLPPFPLQTIFAEIVQKIEEQKVLVQKAINETQALFDSLMNEYFE